MSRSLHLRALLPISAALALSACVSVAPPSPLLTQAEHGLQALHTDPAIARWAPDALAQAGQAVHTAQRAHGDSQHLQHLAFMAENQVEIAKATANANREKSAYAALVAKRDAMGGGNESITTLSQIVIGNSSTPVTPINREGAEVSSATEPTPVPTPAANSTLLTLHAADFNRGNRLTPTAYNAVQGLLARLVQQPSLRVVISGASRAQLATVRQALAESGVPSWRLQTLQTVDRSIDIAFGGKVSTPIIEP